MVPKRPTRLEAALGGCVAVLLVASLFVFLTYDPPASPAVPAEQKRVAAILLTEDLTFWVDVWQGLRETAADLDLRVSEYMFDNSSVGVEEKLHMALLAQVDGLILRPPDTVSPEYLELLGELRDQGACVVTIDRDLPPEWREAYIGIDNQVAGQAAAREALGAVSPEGSLLVLNISAEDTAIGQRTLAFVEEVRRLEPGRVVLAPQLSLNKSEQVRFLSEQLLETPTGYGSIELIYCGGPLMLQQAIAAVAKTGLPVKVMGFSEAREAMDALETGQIYGLFVQPPRDMGRLAAQCVASLLAGTSPDGQVLTAALEYWTQGMVP